MSEYQTEVQRLRAALEEVHEELKTLHFMINQDDDIFHERKKKYLSIIDYVGQSVAGKALSTTYWAREGLIKHQQEEIQRLRVAITAMRQAVWDELVPINLSTEINKIADEALSTTTEPTGTERVRECPECGAPLIKNRWCSRLLCKYGLNNPHGINAPEGDGNDA